MAGPGPQRDYHYHSHPFALRGGWWDYDHEREALCVVLEHFLDQGDTAPNARFNYRYITP